jgi:hypothetical protein
VVEDLAPQKRLIKFQLILRPLFILILNIKYIKWKVNTIKTKSEKLWKLSCSKATFLGSNEKQKHPSKLQHGPKNNKTLSSD